MLICAKLERRVEGLILNDMKLLSYGVKKLDSPKLSSRGLRYAWIAKLALQAKKRSPNLDNSQEAGHLQALGGVIGFER